MNGQQWNGGPPVLQGQVTLTKCVPDGPVTGQTHYRPLERVLFCKIKYFSYGATCNAYEAVDPSGNRRILTEFCPRRFRSSLYRTPAQELRIRENDPRLRQYLEERTLFIRKWQTQSAAQNQDRLFGNNGPQLYFLGDTPYLVMNYEGDSLRDFSGVDPQTLLGALIQAADAIDQAHQSGLLLNDIKPDNLLITGSGGALIFRRLLDYGSAFPLEQMRRETWSDDAVSYSNSFCSPELYNREYRDITFASDVYSFGQTVLYLLCGMTIQELPESVQALQSAIGRYAPADAPIRRLQAQDPDGFYLHLCTFVLHTLSALVMAEDHVFDWQTEPYISGWIGPLRLRRMADVKRMLERLHRAAQPEEILDLHLAWSTARDKARRFETVGFGNSEQGQWEMERQLFSKDMLASYRASDSQALLELEDLTDMEGSFFLEGCSGSGKSVGMRWLYSRIANATGIAEEPTWLPVYLSMERAAASGLSLGAYVARELFGHTRNRALAEQTARRWLYGTRGPRMILLCDGVNETARDSDSALFLGDLCDLARTADPDHLRLIFSGQNVFQELPGFPGTVLRVQPLAWRVVKNYLYSRLPVNAADPNIDSRIENLRQVLTTPQQVHDLCVPHIRKTRLHPRAIPGDASRLLHDYLHNWCAKEKIHRAVCGVNAYSSGQESGEPYGELLMGQLARLCWTMALANEYYIKQSVLLEQLRMVIWADGEDLPALGCAYLTDGEAEQIMSLVWSGVLFELDGEEMHIRHESYRDYLAAEYLAEVFNTYSENQFPPVLMQPIPDRVLGYLLPMLRSDTIHRLCGRVKAERKKRMWKGFIDYLFMRETSRRDAQYMSSLHRDNLVQAGNTMVRIVRAKPFSGRMKWNLIWGLGFNPLILFRKEKL